MKRAALTGALLVGLALAQQSGPAPVTPPGSAVPAPAVPTPPTPEPLIPGPPTPGPPVPGSPVPDPASPEAAPGEGASVSLTRKAKDGKERVIRIVRTGQTDETGVFAACQPTEDDPPATPTLSVFSETGAGGVVVTVDKNVIVAPLALVTQQENGDGHIEVSDGTARFLDEPPPGKTDRLSRCAVEALPVVKPGTVRVTQGATRLNGSKLIYDEKDGIARIEGPIAFERPGQAAEPGRPERTPLTGSSARIDVDVDAETTTLIGGVTLKSGQRTSSAERVVYDDASSIAILYGTADKPASSTLNGDVFRAQAIRYNLDTGDIDSRGPVTGTFQDGEAEASGAAPASTPAAPPSSAPAPAGAPTVNPNQPPRP